MEVEITDNSKTLGTTFISNIQLRGDKLDLITSLIKHQSLIETEWEDTLSSIREQ